MTTERGDTTVWAWRGSWRSEAVRSADPHNPVETMELDAEVVRLAGRRRPRLVFLPTGTHDDRGYVSTVEEHCGHRLGCDVEAPTRFDRSRSAAETAWTIAAADIIYVGRPQVKRRDLLSDDEWNPLSAVAPQSMVVERGRRCATEPIELRDESAPSRSCGYPSVSRSN
jgi:hypothetical protein